MDMLPFHILSCMEKNNLCVILLGVETFWSWTVVALLAQAVTRYIASSTKLLRSTGTMAAILFGFWLESLSDAASLILTWK